MRWQPRMHKAPKQTRPARRHAAKEGSGSTPRSGYGRRASKPRPWPQSWAASRSTRRGQIEVRPTLQTRADDGIFALGDCASCAGADGKPFPTTAQVARQQALFLARSLAGHLAGNKPLGVFRFHDRGSLVALGDYAAYGSLGQHGILRGALIKGWLAKLGHASLYRMHQLDLNGFVKGGVEWLADDLTRMTRPRIGLD
jgi:NADH:quinone reductase (non-electrogenic)